MLIIGMPISDNWVMSIMEVYCRPTIGFSSATFGFLCRWASHSNDHRNQHSKLYLTAQNTILFLWDNWHSFQCLHGKEIFLCIASSLDRHWAFSSSCSNIDSSYGSISDQCQHRPFLYYSQTGQWCKGIRLFCAGAGCCTVSQATPFNHSSLVY